MKHDIYDICIIGGGINGCGIARDAAGRGYSVLLLEKGDLAGETSSASTKLIHGGLRYLEYYEFGLIRKALREREKLLKIAPHIIRPMRFMLPYVGGMRPLWMMRAGVWFYDRLGGQSSLQKSNITTSNNASLKKGFKKGVAYSDAWVEDARLVVLNAMDAKARGADIIRDTECTAIARERELWKVTAGNQNFHARMIVNAAGPWASQIMENTPAVEAKSLRLVQGSHIIVPRLYTDEESYIFQNDDGRIVFTIPYEDEYTLVGTTEVDIGHNPDQKIAITDKEIKYLMDVVHRYFEVSLKQADIVDTYSGVRPLLDEGGDAKSVSRDYKLDMQMVDGLGYLTVLGGKLTTYRILADEALNYINDYFDRNAPSWTAAEALPGGDFDRPRDVFADEQAAKYPFLSKELVRRYAFTYGTTMNHFLKGAKNLDDMGDHLGGTIYTRELDYLMTNEFVKSGEDALKRRTKLYLHIDKKTSKAVDDYIAVRIEGKSNG